MQIDNLEIECIIEDDSYTEKFSKGMCSDQSTLRVHICRVFVALCNFSEAGHAKVLAIFDHHKIATGHRYRFSTLLDILNDVSCQREEKEAILNLVNALIGCATSYDKIFIRNEFLGLKLVNTLSLIKILDASCPNIIAQIQTFESQMLEDEDKTLIEEDIDINSPLEMFNIILKQVSGTPEEVIFLTILRHLMLININNTDADAYNGKEFSITAGQQTYKRLSQQRVAKNESGNDHLHRSDVWAFVEKAILAISFMACREEGERAMGKIVQQACSISHSPSSNNISLSSRRVMTSQPPNVHPLKMISSTTTPSANTSYTTSSQNADQLPVFSPNTNGSVVSETSKTLSVPPPPPPLPPALMLNGDPTFNTVTLNRNRHTTIIPNNIDVTSNYGPNQKNHQALLNCVGNYTSPTINGSNNYINQNTPYKISHNSAPVSQDSSHFNSQNMATTFTTPHDVKDGFKVATSEQLYGDFPESSAKFPGIISNLSKYNTQQNSCNVSYAASTESLPQLLTPTPKGKLKTLNWIRIPIMKILAQSHASSENVWMSHKKKNLADYYNIDFTYLENLFVMPSVSSPSKFSKGKYGARGSDANGVNYIDGSGKRKSADGFGANSRSYSGCGYEGKRQEILLLEPKRNLNISIYLKQFKNGYEEIISNIEEGKGMKVGVERLRGLLKLMPEPYEIEMLKAFDGEFARLGDAEKFLKKLILLPNYQLRIEGLLLKEDFINNLDDILPALDALIYTAQDIKNCKLLHEILLLTVYVGNFINSGGYAGNAAGIKLTSLLKISEIRGNNPKIGLIHFVAEQLNRMNIQHAGLSSELKYLEKAQKINLESLILDVSSLTTKCGNLSSQVAKADGDLKNILEDFLKYAKQEMESIQKDLTEIERWRLNLSDFFCEERETFKLEECFKIFYVFLERLRKAEEENKARRMLEEKRKSLKPKELKQSYFKHKARKDKAKNGDCQNVKDDPEDNKSSENSSIFTEQDNDSLRSNSPGSYKRRTRKYFQPSSSEDLIEYLSKAANNDETNELNGSARRRLHDSNHHLNMQKGNTVGGVGIGNTTYSNGSCGSAPIRKNNNALIINKLASLDDSDAISLPIINHSPGDAGNFNNVQINHNNDLHKMDREETSTAQQQLMHNRQLSLPDQLKLKAFKDFNFSDKGGISQRGNIAIPSKDQDINSCRPEYGFIESRSALPEQQQYYNYSNKINSEKNVFGKNAAGYCTTQRDSGFIDQNGHEEEEGEEAGTDSGVPEDDSTNSPSPTDYSRKPHLDTRRASPLRNDLKTMAVGNDQYIEKSQHDCKDLSSLLNKIDMETAASTRNNYRVGNKTMTSIESSSCKFFPSRTENKFLRDSSAQYSNDTILDKKHNLTHNTSSKTVLENNYKNNPYSVTVQSTSPFRQISAHNSCSYESSLPPHMDLIKQQNNITNQKQQQQEFKDFYKQVLLNKQNRDKHHSPPARTVIKNTLSGSSTKGIMSRSTSSGNNKKNTLNTKAATNLPNSKLVASITKRNFSTKQPITNNCDTVSSSQTQSSSTYSRKSLPSSYGSTKLNGSRTSLLPTRTTGASPKLHFEEPLAHRIKPSSGTSSTVNSTTSNIATASVKKYSSTKNARTSDLNTGVTNKSNPSNTLNTQKNLTARPYKKLMSITITYDGANKNNINNLSGRRSTHNSLKVDQSLSKALKLDANASVTNSSSPLRPSPISTRSNLNRRSVITNSRNSLVTSERFKSIATSGLNNGSSLSLVKKTSPQILTPTNHKTDGKIKTLPSYDINNNPSIHILNKSATNVILGHGRKPTVKQQLPNIKSSRLSNGSLSRDFTSIANHSNQTFRHSPITTSGTYSDVANFGGNKKFSSRSSARIHPVIENKKFTMVAK